MWLADLTGDMLSEGTATRSAPKIAEAAARMGGALDISVGENRTEIGGDVLSEFAPEMVALVADVARNPKFPESELTRLKGDRARELSIAKSQPQPLAQEKFRAVLYGDHPYGRLFPTEAMLQGYTIAQVQAASTTATSAPRARTSTSSAVSTSAAMEAAIRKAFGDWKKGPAPKHDEAVAEERARRLPHRPARRPAVDDQHRHAGDRSVEPGLGPLYLTNVLLGGSFASRITSNIREQKGYTYSPQGQLSSRYRDAYWVEIADVTTSVDRTRAQGDHRRGRPAPGRAALGEGAQGLPELPRRASSSSRTRRARASSASSSSSTSTACRPTT